MARPASQTARENRDTFGIPKAACSFATFAILCGAIAVPLTFIVTFEQAILAGCLPIATVWAITELHQSPSDETPFPETGWAIRVAAVGSVIFVLHQKKESPCLLPIFALASVAANSTRIPLSLPGASFLPYSALVALILAVVFGGDEVRNAAGIAIAPLVDLPQSWGVAAISAVFSSIVLTAWSVYWVRGDHGPIQDSMGPTLTPFRVVMYSVINGIGEELEFRMLIFGGLVARPAHHEPLEPLWVVCALVLQAAFFAALHFVGGFPSRASGFVMLFSWAILLGIILHWTGSIVIPILLHIELDIVVFTLLLLEARGRGRRRSQSSDQHDVADGDQEGEDAVSATCSERTEIVSREPNVLGLAEED